MTDVQHRNESARQAANILYSSRSYSNDPPASYNGESNGMGVAAINDRELKFSSVRRMFCLFTAFDFLLMLLLWIIYINVSYFKAVLQDLLTSVYPL